MFDLKTSLLLLLLVIVGSTSCQKEGLNEDISEDGGKLRIELKADPTIFNYTQSTRTGDSAPEIGDFSVEIRNAEGIVYSSDSFDEFPEELELSPGLYSIKAFFGDEISEGFDDIYFEASQDFTIETLKVSSIELTAEIKKTALSFEYTRSFTSYFTSYSIEASSSSGSEAVVFSQGVLDKAFLIPSNISIIANVTTSTGKETSLNISTIENALPKHYYRIGLDVDAGNSELLIIYNDTLGQDTISIDISDEALSQAVPIFTTNGFTSELKFEQIEGDSPPTPCSAYINASSDIKSVMLKSNSTYFGTVGLSEDIELVSASVSDVERLKTAGIELKGLGENVVLGKLARVDFTRLLSKLPYGEGAAGEHQFELVITDKLDRISVDKLVLHVGILSNELALTESLTTDFGVTTATIKAHTKGSAENIMFEHLKGGTWISLEKTILSPEIPLEENNYQVQIIIPDGLQDNSELRMISGSQIINIPIIFNPVNYLLQTLSDGDVWATKANLHIVTENESFSTFYKDKAITVSYQVAGSEDWITPIQTKNGNIITITGLAEDAVNTHDYTLKAVAVLADGSSLESSNTPTITTEKAVQLPNAGFEDWNVTKTREGGWLKKDVYRYFPYKAGATPFWATNTERSVNWTTSPIDVTTNPVVSLVFDKAEGNVAAEIRTSLHGGAYTTSPGFGAYYPQAAFAGSLFIGDYIYSNKAGTKNQGKDFASRPSQLTFQYKYEAYNTDKFLVKVKLENRANDPFVTIAETSYTSKGYTGSDSDTFYQTAEIDIPYQNSSLKATHISVEFLASDKTSFEKEDFDLNMNLLLYIDVDNEQTTVTRDALQGSKLKIDNIKLKY